MQTLKREKISRSSDSKKKKIIWGDEERERLCMDEKISI